MSNREQRQPSRYIALICFFNSNRNKSYFGITTLFDLQVPLVDDINIHSVIFDNAQKAVKFENCNNCNRRWFNLAVQQSGLCTFCNNCILKSKFNPYTRENNMDPGELPLQLKRLTFIEEQLIAQVHPVISMYRIRGSQYGYKGHVINFPQDISTIANRLPYTFDIISKFIIVRRNEGEGHSDFFVNRNHVRDALLYLKANNRWYSNIEIDEDILQLLPEGESVFAQILSSQNVNVTQPNDQEDDSFNDMENIAVGVLDTGVPNIQGHDNREIINRILGLPNLHPLPWPELGNVPINEFNTDGYICRAFPTLYPTGKK